MEPPSASFHFLMSSIYDCCGLKCPSQTRKLKSNPKMMVLGMGLWGGDWDTREGPHNWDWCPSRRDPTELPQPFLHIRTWWEGGHLWPRRGSHWTCWPPNQGHPDSTTMRIKFLLFISNPVCGSWLEEAEWTKTPNSRSSFKRASLIKSGPLTLKGRWLYRCAH